MENNITYRILLPSGRRFSFVAMGKGHLYVKKTNSRPVKCGKCSEKIHPGAGVWYGLYRDGNYFVHINCAKALIHKYGSKNYRENMMGNLENGINQEGEFPAQLLCDGIQKFTFVTNAEGIDRLTPA